MKHKRFGVGIISCLMLLSFHANAELVFQRFEFQTGSAETRFYPSDSGSFVTDQRIYGFSYRAFFDAWNIRVGVEGALDSDGVDPSADNSPPTEEPFALAGTSCVDCIDSWDTYDLFYYDIQLSSVFKLTDHFGLMAELHRRSENYQYRVSELKTEIWNHSYYLSLKPTYSFDINDSFTLLFFGGGKIGVVDSEQRYKRADEVNSSLTGDVSGFSYGASLNFSPSENWMLSAQMSYDEISIDVSDLYSYDEEVTRMVAGFSLFF